MQKVHFIQQEARRQGKRVYRVDIDYKNAFNAMSQTALWQVMRMFEIPDVDLLKTAGKWWKCDPISEHRLRSSRHGLAMNLVDWLRTSADERVLSGCRAVVICVMGCLRGLVVLHSPFVSREQSL